MDSQKQPESKNLTKMLLIIAPVLAVCVIVLSIGAFDAARRGSGFLFYPSFTPSATSTAVPTNTPTFTPIPSLTSTLTLPATETPTLTPTDTATPEPTFDRTAFVQAFYAEVTSTEAASRLLLTPTITPTVPDEELKTGMRSRNYVTGKELFFIQTESDLNLKGFWIDWSDVSNAEYTLCVNSAFCQAPESDQVGSIEHYYSDSSYGFYPVVNVTRPQAQIYCAWVGMELMSMSDWELAANTSEFLPWNLTINRITDHPTEEKGSSNIRGNVWQWTRNNDDKGDALIAGASWRTSLYDSDHNRMGAMDPDAYADDLGFRCVSYVR